MSIVSNAMALYFHQELSLEESPSEELSTAFGAGAGFETGAGFEIGASFGAAAGFGPWIAGASVVSLVSCL
jgi:hypothetical protein